MLTIIFAENPLARTTWERFDTYSDLCHFLLEIVAPKYSGHFPDSAKIYLEKIDKDHDITPATPADAEGLSKVKGTVYVVIWPAAQAIAVQAAVTLGMLVVTSVLKKFLIPDEKVTNRNIPTGSPNNLPGQRKNTARVLQRIPDIYGTVKCTPDLIQFPYIHYEDNLQVEVVAAIIGRGEYDIQEENIFEGQTRVNQIPGASLAIYAPHTVPVEDVPQLQIGTAIEDPLLTVVPVREVTGEQLLAPNNTVIWGDDDEATETGFEHRAAMFGYPSTGVGKIVFIYGDHNRAQSENAFYFTNRLNVGDKFGLRWQGNASGLPDAMEARGAVSVDPHALDMGAGGDANIPDLELLPDTPDDDHYEVTGVTVHDNYNIDILSQGPAVEYTISVPASKQAEWDKIILFNPTQFSAVKAPVGYMFNRMSMVYVLNYRLGPFFCNDPNMEEVHFNFIADKGLWVDDGRRQVAYGSVVNLSFDALTPGGIEIIVELTPADVDGIATGPTERFDIDDGLVMIGSSTQRDFIGQTFKVIPSFTGRFLVSVYRNTIQYWRTSSSSFLSMKSGVDELNWSGTANTVFGAAVFRQRGQWADDIKWTHCYSVSTPKYYPFTSPLTDLGDVTIVHSRTAQVKYAPPREYEKNLNLIATRVIPFWDGTSFGGSGSAATERGLDAAFHVMKSYALSGIIPDANIDFEGIAQAFDDVFQAFGTTEATNFSHTFDAEQTSFEDILSAIGESCFITFYRQGNMVKASADVSKESATLLFNHRNKLHGSETKNFSFGTGEENYDGVELEYQDNLDNQVKTYIAPIGIANPRNPQKIRVAGVRTRVKAAMHAWRAAHRLQYQNTILEFDSCEEAALSVVKDKVLIADGTGADVQNGEIIRIDGLTVYTSQEVVVSGSSSYTLFIQDVDGTVQSLPVVTDETPNSLILGGAPSGTLVIDADAGIYPKYILSRDQNSISSAYHIKETQFKNRGVYSVIATNYSEGYYFFDALRLWLTFNEYSGFPPVLKFFDRGPFELDFEEVGSPTAVVDAERQIVYQGPDSNSYLRYPDFSGTTLVSYTVAAWVRLDSYISEICRSNAGGTTFVVRFLSSSQELEIIHDTTVVAAYLGVELSEWTHVGVVYDESIETLTIYINGEPEQTAVDVLPFDSFTGLRVFALDGKGDEFRIYNKPKNGQFMRELYQKSLNPLF